ncbi:UNVERIFIED_CONTAM: hypothetical protein FKN15_032877 [Acipenser sinensis]
MAQETQRFSGHPPIPRPSQLPFLPRKSRAYVGELPTSGGQRPALQVSSLSSLASSVRCRAMRRNSPCLFYLPNPSLCEVYVIEELGCEVDCPQKRKYCY